MGAIERENNTKEKKVKRDSKPSIYSVPMDGYAIIGRMIYSLELPRVTSCLWGHQSSPEFHPGPSR